MANTQNGFGTRNRPKKLETTSQIVRRRRLQKALMKSERAEKELKALGVSFGSPTPPPAPRPKKKDNAFKRFGQWLTQRG